jgi:cytochrome b6-f complex iron-sulfur subunit
MTDTQQPTGSAPAAPSPTRRSESILDGSGLAGVREETDRRGFISWLAIGWIAFAAGFGALGSIAIRFLFPNVLFEPPSSFKAGFPSEFTVGVVDERFKSKYGVWIVRDDSSIYALSTVCTHLGCTPNWLGAEQKFKCPCHGSGFYITGINFEGPAPRPLERHKVFLAEDGQIVVDKNFKYQFEKGQWSNPDSFVSA